MADASRSGTPVVVIVAIIGLLSTVTASALGGYWASRSVERQIEFQRTAEVFELRREAYIQFLRATTQACNAQEGGEQAKINSTGLEVIHQGALVHFLASPELDHVATPFMNAVIDGDACADLESFVGCANPFVDTARTELQ